MYYYWCGTCTFQFESSRGPPSCAQVMQSTIWDAHMHPSPLMCTALLSQQYNTYVYTVSVPRNFCSCSTFWNAGAVHEPV